MHKKLLTIISLGFLLTYFTQGTHAILAQNDEAEQPLTADTVSAFIDTFMQAQMADLHVPGAAIVVVQGNSVLFAKGYGMADLAQQTPVDVNRTLFRAGSVSKLFTATAVMQLVERGKIDLHTDVNTYLQSIQLNPRFDRPVTVADLLLHTAGFDEVFFGMHVRETDELLPLADFVQAHLPERYNPPGVLISYNDHGYTLAGLLIEDVSGLPFDEYVATHILEPLQMRSSTFTQPLLLGFQERMAVGYRYNGSDYQPYKLDFVQISPAAALIGPAGEMAHFMIAHLNEGRFDELAILQPKTVAEMQQTQFAHHPMLRGRGYGFSEWRENGRRAVFHDGGNPGFLSRLFLLPEEDVGFYLLFNSDQHTSASRFHRRFATQFLDTFFPEGDVRQSDIRRSEEPHADGQLTLSTAESQHKGGFQISGYYRDVQGYSRDTMERIASLMNQFPVQASEQKLTVFGRAYGAIDRLVFYNEPEERTVVFRADVDGEITHLFVGTGAYEKVPWYEAKPMQIGLVIWFLNIFTLAIAGGIRWHTASRLLRGSLITIGVTNAIFLVGLALALTQMDIWRFAYGPPLLVRGLLVLPLLTLVLTLLVAALTALGWQNGGWGWRARLYISVVTVTLLGFPFFLNFWNLLGFRY